MKKSIQIESDFKKTNVAAMSFISVFGIVLLIWSWFYSDKINDDFYFYFGLPLVGLVTTLVILIELPKIKKIRLSDKAIEIKNSISGRVEEIPFSALEGYKIQYQTTQHDVYKSILLYKNGGLAHEISELYVDNIQEIEKYLKTKIDYLGVEKFRFFNYIITRIAKK